MSRYVVSAGWCEGREDFYEDGTCRVETDSYGEAEEAFHKIWFYDLREEYDYSWDAFCDADNPECWKSISCLKDGEVVSEFIEYERMEEEERPRYRDIQEAFEAALR